MEQYDQIGARLDRLPLARFHYRIFGIISFSLLLTGFLSYSGNVVLAKLVSNGWSNNFLNAAFTSALMFGYFIGSLTGGFIGDYFGRRRAFRINLLIVGIAATGAAFVPDMYWLIFFRFLMGTGMGALIMVGYASFTEFIPATVRGKWSARLSFVGNWSPMLSAGKLNIDDVDFARFSQAKLLSLASIFNSPLLDGKALTEIFTQAKARQMIICADMIKPRLNETLDDICEALSYVDYLFPNFAEAKLLTGKETLDEIADCFLACGVKTVVIKTGKDGCFIKRGDMTMKVPAVAGITAIDTIGAGDNFASGFIAALLEGKNLRECARFANATAAISVLSVGATTGVKNRKLVEQLLEEYEG